MNKVHEFEKAGLGLAPFRLMGVEHRVGPVQTFSETLGVTVTVGSPGQPMGCCAYCATGIADCFVIRSSDGKTFDVGSTCVDKTGDAGLRRGVNRIVRDAAKKREAVRIKSAEALLKTDEDLRAALALEPSPQFSPSATALAWAEWMMLNAGHSGRLKVARFITKINKKREAVVRG